MKRALAPFLVGFVSIQAQTLLLREYLVLFGGSELSIGFLMACCSPRPRPIKRGTSAARQYGPTGWRACAFYRSPCTMTPD